MFFQEFGRDLKAWFETGRKSTKWFMLLLEQYLMLIGTELKTKKSWPNGNYNSTYNACTGPIFCAQERLSQKRILAFPKNSLMSLRQCNLVCCDFDRYKRVLQCLDQLQMFKWGMLKPEHSLLTHSSFTFVRRKQIALHKSQNIAVRK